MTTSEYLAEDAAEEERAQAAADKGLSYVGRFYPSMPPLFPGEDQDAYTNRLLGIGDGITYPYLTRRNRQCSLGWHGECSQRAFSAEARTCGCPCHTVGYPLPEVAAEPEPEPEPSTAEALVADLLTVTADLGRYLAAEAAKLARPQVARHQAACNKMVQSAAVQKQRDDDLIHELRRQVQATVNRAERAERERDQGRAENRLNEHRVRILRALVTLAAFEDEDGHVLRGREHELTDALDDPCMLLFHQWVPDDGPEGGEVVDRWCLLKRQHTVDHLDADGETFSDSDVMRGSV